MDALTEFFEELVGLDVGDIVQLVSGGPRMTIVNVSGEIFDCIWFTDDKRLLNGKFNQNCVNYIHPDEE